MKLFLRTNDHFLSKESFQLLYDKQNELLITHPRPENIDAYYESDKYISHSNKGTTALERIYGIVKELAIRRKLKLIKRRFPLGTKPSLLDVGCGTGDFLDAAKGQNWKVTGVEPNDNARMQAAGKKLCVYSNLNQVGIGPFEVVTLWHVLEHLPDLETSIANLVERVDENGILIVAVPNFKCWDAGYYKSYWAGYDVPRHLWHFSKTSIKKLFAKHSFELVKTCPMWFDAFYVALLSEEYKTGKKNWIKAALVGVYSNFRGLITKEFSSHIYILEKRK